MKKKTMEENVEYIADLCRFVQFYLCAALLGLALGAAVGIVLFLVKVIVFFMGGAQ